MSTPSPATDKIPGPLPLWYLGVLLVLPVALFGAGDLIPGFDDFQVMVAVLALILVYYFLEQRVHRSLGVNRRIQYTSAVLGYTLAYVVVVLVAIYVGYVGFTEVAGYPMPSVLLGALCGVAVVIGAFLEHSLIRRATASAAT